MLGPCAVPQCREEELVKRTIVALTSTVLVMLAAPAAQASAAQGSAAQGSAATVHGSAPGVHAPTSRPSPLAGNNDLVYWGDFTVTNEAARRCLDADTTENGIDGNKVQVWDCNNEPQQTWSLFETSYGSHVFFLVNVKYWKCLDGDLNTLPDNGTWVQLWGCNSRPQQEWQMPRWDYSNGYPWLGWHQLYVNPYRWAVLDADSRYGLGNGSKVQVWQNLNGPNQYWHLWPWG
jgi:hypothetical protein